MNVVKLLAIVIVTVAVTLLCIRSGQAMAKAPVTVPVHAVYQTPAPLTTTAATAPETVTDPTPNATASADWTDAERAVEPVQAASRSLDGGGGGSPVGLPAARMAGTVPAAVVRGKFVTRQQPLGAAYHPDFTARGDVDDADEDDGDDNPSRPANIIVDAGVYNVHSSHFRKLINNGYSTIDADVLVAEEDGSVNYHDAYDQPYGGGYKPAPDGPNDWNTAGRPPGNSGGGAAQPLYGMMAPYPPSGHVPAPGYKPRTPYIYPPSGVGAHHQHPDMTYQRPGETSVGHSGFLGPLHHLQMIIDKIEWQKVGILALLKVGMAKLKVFSFLKLLFLLVFKLKLFMIALFFKFLLALKLMKFFKLLMIPLILIGVLPIMSSIASPSLIGGLLSIPSRIIDYLTGPVYVPGTAPVSTKNSATDSTVLSSVTSAKNSGGGPSSSASLQERANINLHDSRRRETLGLSDATFDIFQKVLDSEKCLERIACRMALVEKAGILPTWVNGVVRRVSKFIPNDKLKSYVTIYDNVTDEMHRKSEAPDNWESWCVERYDCDTSNITNKSDTRI